MIKRIYDEPLASDGYRVLVDRLWPRGIKKSDAQLDEWAKDVAPSTELRKFFDHKSSRFEEFSQRYRAELHDNADAKRLREVIQTHNNVTLLYGARDPHVNHAVVLQDWLAK